MQKFKFNKNNLPISIRSRLTPTDLQQLPELFLLEGELLEDGTVEKCCLSYFVNSVHAVNCHNKKEEKMYPCEHGFYFKSCLKCFNREILKELTEEELDKSIALLKEEVKLPEMLVIDGTEASNQALENDKHLAGKINQILTYLASKEKK